MAKAKKSPKKGISYFSPIDEIIKRNILAVRKEESLSQRQFAEILKSNESYIKAIEQGRFSPSNEFIFRCARKFNLSIDWIFGVKGAQQKLK